MSAWTPKQVEQIQGQKLEAVVAAACARALRRMGSEAAPLVTPAKRPDLADFQSNNAFALAKGLGRDPREVAAELAALVDEELGELGSAQAAGAFVNARLSDKALLAAAARAGGGELFADLGGARVVIDHSSPNCAKRMHAGHLRSTVIGDALARLLEASGARVKRVNHLGDWGTPFGVIIEQAAAEGAQLGSSSIGEMEAIYKRGAARFKEDEAFAGACRRSTAALQAGREPQAGHWRAIREKTLVEIQAIYDELGIGLSPSDAVGESFHQPQIPGVLAELLDRGVIERSEGALAYFGPKGSAGASEDEGPLLLEKSAASGGGYLYGATDVAALKARATADGGDALLLYVVDERQGPHFSRLFELGEQAGWLGEGPGQSRAFHAAFGVMLGADGKPFKTRSGESFPLSELIAEAVARGVALSREKSPEAPEAAIEALGRQTGIGALKWGDLSRSRQSAVKFDLDELVSLEGNTAPYLQYARVRALSIARKARASAGGMGAAREAFGDPSERQLALDAARCRDGAAQAALELAPHHLCERLHALAQSMGSFYARCPVVGEGGEVDPLRLALVESVAGALGAGLAALGIESPEAMPKPAERPRAKP